MKDRPGIYDDAADPDVWSQMAVGDKRLTWKEAYEHVVERLRHADALAGVLADLDRCEHGRHEGDVCSGVGGCGGPSRGNLLLRTGEVIGHGLAGARQPIVMPPERERNDPDAWYSRPA